MPFVTNFISACGYTPSQGGGSIRMMESIYSAVISDLIDLICNMPSKEPFLMKISKETINWLS